MTLVASCILALNFSLAVILTLLVNITFLFHTCYRVCLIIISNLGSRLNCDGCHMWGRRC